MSSISSQPTGCDCKVYPFMVTAKTCVTWSTGMDSSYFASDGDSCEDCLCVCFPFTTVADLVSCPFITPVWLVSKLVNKCKNKNKIPSENIVVNA